MPKMTRLKELEKFQGKWSASLKDISLSFNGTRVVINESVTSEVKIAPTKNPAEIDFTPDTGPTKGMTAKRHYKLDGDTVTFCHGPEGGARPRAFKSTADFILSVYKRMK